MMALKRSDATCLILSFSLIQKYLILFKNSSLNSKPKNGKIILLKFNISEFYVYIQEVLSFTIYED
jgi:hypothetical protein